MNDNTQQKFSESHEIPSQAFEAALAAIEECRAKPPYDYQRVILCLTSRLDLGAKLATRSGATLIGPAPPLDSKRPPAVVIFANPGACDPAILESIVKFVNRTRGVVVLTVTEQEVADWHEHWQVTAAQIRRRTHITIDFEAEG
jgi:hypothetical protein